MSRCSDPSLVFPLSKGEERIEEGLKKDYDQNLQQILGKAKTPNAAQHQLQGRADVVVEAARKAAIGLQAPPAV
jgi:hypothetical protein